MKDFWFRALLFAFSPRCYVLLIALGLGFLFGLVLLALPGALVLDATTRLVFGEAAPDSARWPAAMAVSWAAPWCVPLLYGLRRPLRRLPAWCRMPFYIVMGAAWVAAVALAVEAWRRF